MALNYGCVKCKVISEPMLKSKRLPQETQYHLHVSLQVAAPDGGAERWDAAINVGTNDADDLLKYKLIYDFHHAVREALANSPPGFQDLTGAGRLPAMDFLRSDVLAETGPWRDSDVMDGSESPEPLASLKRLLHQAKVKSADVFLFGRTYTTGGPGIHDVHMNQGSSGRFLNNGVDDHNDHNDAWQDGALLVNLGADGWAGYFTAFTQQQVPTDDLGNPVGDSHFIENSDLGSLAGQ